MPSLTIEGIPQPVQIDASFASLSPQDQAATVDHIRAAWNSRSASPAPSPRPTDTSFGGAINQGIRSVVDGVSKTGSVLAGDRSVGEDAPTNYSPASTEVTEGFRNWDAGRVLTNLPRAVVEAAPGMALTSGGGGVGAAIGTLVAPGVGTVVGGLAGSALASAAQSFGKTAETRARNDGRSQIDGSDLAGAAGTTAVSAGLDAVGARGAGGLARRIVREGGTEAAQDVVQQVGETAGTERGLSVDPAQSAAAGATGLATRAAGAVPLAAVRGTGQAIATRGAERAMGEMNVDHAASVERVGRLYDRHADNQAGSRKATPEEILNTAHGELTADVTTLLRDAHRQGWINDDQRTEIREVFESARRHNKSLSDGGTIDDPNTVPIGLAKIDELNAPAPFQAALRDLFMDVDTLSAAARKKNLTGPFEKLGDLAGRAGSVALAAGTGGPAGIAAGLALSLGGNPLGARIGAKVGSAVDSFAGSRQPAVLLARRKAQSILEKAGRDPGDSVDTLGGVNALLGDERLSRRAAAGLPVDPESIRRADVLSAARRAMATPTEPNAPLTPPARAEPPRTAAEPQGPAANEPRVGEPSRGMPQGWNAGVMRYAWDAYRTPLTADGVEAALGRLEQRGLDPEVADAARAGGRIDRKLMEEVTQEALKAAGFDPRNPFGARPDDAIVAGSTRVRDVLQWSGAKDSYQASVARASERAHAAGDYPLAELVETFGSTTDTDLPGNVRVLRAKALIALSTDPVEKARRQASLGPLIARYQKD